MLMYSNVFFASSLNVRRKTVKFLDKNDPLYTMTGLSKRRPNSQVNPDHRGFLVDGAVANRVGSILRGADTDVLTAKTGTPINQP
jgi:hypothetical protein